VTFHNSDANVLYGGWFQFPEANVNGSIGGGRDLAGLGGTAVRSATRGAAGTALGRITDVVAAGNDGIDALDVTALRAFISSRGTTPLGPVGTPFNP
jgi:subtilisin family serine protease